MSAALLAGGALATLAGVGAGTYYLMDPSRKNAPIQPLALGAVVGSVGLIGGLLLSKTSPELAKGMIYGAIGAAVVSTPAAKAGVFYVAAVQLANILPAKSA